MQAGSIQSIPVCIPLSASDQPREIDREICPSAGGQAFQVQQQQAYVLSPDSAGYINSIAQPFDYTVAAGFWGVAFTTIVGLWLLSHGAGAIVNFLRRA